MKISRWFIIVIHLFLVVQILHTFFKLNIFISIHLSNLFFLPLDDFFINFIASFLDIGIVIACLFWGCWHKIFNKFLREILELYTLELFFEHVVKLFLKTSYGVGNCFFLADAVENFIICYWYVFLFWFSFPEWYDFLTICHQWCVFCFQLRNSCNLGPATVLHFESYNWFFFRIFLSQLLYLICDSLIKIFFKINFLTILSFKSRNFKVQNHHWPVWFFKKNTVNLEFISIGSNYDTLFFERFRLNKRS